METNNLNEIEDMSDAEFFSKDVEQVSKSAAEDVEVTPKEFEEKNYYRCYRRCRYYTYHHRRYRRC
jgi:hypothetical protein